MLKKTKKVSVVTRQPATTILIVTANFYPEVSDELVKGAKAALKKAGLNKKSSPIFIQSFELGSLNKLKKLTKNKLIFLDSIVIYKKSRIN